MNGNDGGSSVLMTEEMMASLYPMDFESGLSKCLDDLLAGETRHIGHAGILTF